MSISQPAIHVCTHSIYENLRITFAFATKTQLLLPRYGVTEGNFLRHQCFVAQTQKSVFWRTR